MHSKEPHQKLLVNKTKYREKWTQLVIKIEILNGNVYNGLILKMYEYADSERTLFFRIALDWKVNDWNLMAH